MNMSTGSMPNAANVQRLEQWLAEYGNGILRTCYVYLKDAALAQDAMQDTFVKAWQKMDTFEGRNGASPKTWLTHIAVNVCRDYRRSRWLRLVDMRKSIEEMPLPVYEATPEEQDLFESVMALPDKYREAVLLYYYQELTLEEAAQVLKMSRSTLHHRLQKARQLLKVSLEGSEMEWART